MSNEVIEMAFEEDFVSAVGEGVVEFRIGERVFILRYLTGMEADEIDSKTVKYYDDGGEPKADIDQTKRNALYLAKAIVEAPWNHEGRVKWKELTEPDRINILSNLKASIYNQLVRKVYQMNSVDAKSAEKSGTS